MIYVVAYTDRRGYRHLSGGRFTTKYEAERHQSTAVKTRPDATVMQFKNLTEASKWLQA
jgi:hypothetical protein